MVSLLVLVPATVGMVGVATVLTFVYRQRRYTGRHRATGLSTMEEVAEATRRRWRAYPELADSSRDAAEFGNPAPAKGAYAHLRPDELDSTAERMLLLAERRKRLPSVWGTPMELDDWETEPTLVVGAR